MFFPGSRRGTVEAISATGRDESGNNAQPPNVNLIIHPKHSFIGKQLEKQALPLEVHLVIHGQAPLVAEAEVADIDFCVDSDRSNEHGRVSWKS